MHVAHGRIWHRSSWNSGHACIAKSGLPTAARQGWEKWLPLLITSGGTCRPERRGGRLRMIHLHNSIYLMNLKCSNIQLKVQKTVRQLNRFANGEEKLEQFQLNFTEIVYCFYCYCRCALSKWKRTMNEVRRAWLWNTSARHYCLLRPIPWRSHSLASLQAT